MIKLLKVDAHNVWDIIKLEVDDKQKDYVATNNESIIEAYTLQKGKAFTFGIYDDDLLIGFVMLGYDVDDEPIYVRNCYSLWRFMIDKKYQNKGYGKKALEVVLDYIKTYPCGYSEYCYLSYVEDNIVAKRLYTSFGFKETGDKDEDEIIAIYKLN